ncbi:MAG: polyprenyl synthetase family protein [Crocinitomicaceae bacterium]|nr:polyprenyl synthetase family protein [Crocinitomicaceae bacterium]
MEGLAAYTRKIEAGLTAVDFPTSPNQLYDPLRYFLTIGGKRIRPILTLLGAQLFSASVDKAFPQAISIELFHNFTLIHDDIMDAAPLRRNQETVHVKWNNDIAILSGDVLLIKAYQELGKIDPAHLPEAFALFNKTAIEVCEGQQMDMDFEIAENVTIDQYIEMIRLKTSVLLGCALEIGAIVAEASKKDREALYNFGQHIGIAFQIQDDILDLYADPDKFGKQVGGDVIANKKTLLYLTALEKATLKQKEQLRQLENEQDLTLKVERTRQLFDQIGTKQICQERMSHHFDQAIHFLQLIDVSDSSKEPLQDLSEFLMQRDQ